MLSLFLALALVAAAGEAAFAAAEVGDRLVGRDFALLEGGAVNIPVQGKSACVINLWATWCPPCREEMPQLQVFYDKYKDNQKIAFYLINYAETAGEIRNFMRKNNFAMPTLLDPNGDAADMLYTAAIPTTVIVGADGKVIFRKVGAVTAAELEAALAGI
jgi:thiol-disulfide isomerase/thioredoxin